jgi:hypothetical protein
MMEIMRREENVKCRVIGVERQLRKKKWQVHNDSRQQYEAERYGPL